MIVAANSSIFRRYGITYFYKVLSHCSFVKLIRIRIWIQIHIEKNSWILIRKKRVQIHSPASISDFRIKFCFVISLKSLFWALKSQNLESRLWAAPHQIPLVLMGSCSSSWNCLASACHLGWFDYLLTNTFQYDCLCESVGQMDWIKKLNKNSWPRSLLSN